MSRRSMKARDFWDEKQMSLFDYVEGKARNQQRKAKENKHDSPSARLKRLERRGVRVAFPRRGGPKGWEVIPPEEVAASAGRRRG